MVKMNDSEFKKQYGTESQIPVGKLNRLMTVYQTVKDGTRLLSKLDKKD